MASGSGPQAYARLEDVEHWIGVYAQVVSDLTDVGDRTPSPELLSCIMACSARLKWWEQRRAELLAEGEAV